MRDLIELAERCEAADASEQRLMLAEGFNTLFPQPEQANEPEWQGPGTLREPLYHVWFVRKCRFTTMLDAEAYESAALKLVPVGWSWSLGEMRGIGKFRGWLNDHNTPDGLAVRHVDADATTPALAITAACLRAIAGEGE